MAFNMSNLSMGMEPYLDERAISKALKTAEEIQRHTLSEDLDDVKKARCLLSFGDVLQQISVMQSLPLLFESDPNACLKDIIPRVQKVLPTADSDIHLVATNSFLTILKKELVPQTTFTQSFLQSILTSIDSRDPVVANAWLETLLDVIDLLPTDVVRHEILVVAVAKGQICQPISSRLACCKLLGKISTKFEPFLIEKEILPIAQSLCQDVNYEVRANMCQQLDSIAHGLGQETTKTAILQQLVELANDEESHVRIAAVETVVNILGLMDSGTCNDTIIPLVKKLCQDSLKCEELVLIVIAKELGKLCHGLSPCLSSEEKLWFIVFYQDLAKLGLAAAKEAVKIEMIIPDWNRMPKQTSHQRTIYHQNTVEIHQVFFQMPDLVPVMDSSDRHAEIRHCCAFNFPSIILLTVGSHFLQDQLLTTFHSLVNDPFFFVRRTMAAGIHEVIRLIGPVSTILIKKDVIRLLNDNCVEVLDGLIPHLSTCIETFCPDKGTGNESGTSLLELSEALLHCESVIGQTYNWRLHSQFFEQISCVAKCFPSDFVHEKFTPFLRQKIKTLRPIPCRLAAARMLLSIMRYNRRARNREEIYSLLREDLCYGRSSHNRKLFIDVCCEMMGMFSRLFFKQRFFSNMVDLSDDSVANVRLKLCTVLPRMKSLLKVPSDNKQLQQLESCVRKFMINEKDRDISAAVRIAIAQLDQIELFPPSGESPEEPDEQRKIDEELRIGSLDDCERDQKSDKAFRRKTIMHGVPIRSDPLQASKRISLTSSSVVTTSNASTLKKTHSQTTKGSGKSPSIKVLSKSNTTQRKPLEVGKILADIPGRSLNLHMKPPIDINPPQSHNVSAAPVVPIDPTTDEFYVDAGIRISSLKSSNSYDPSSTYYSRLPYDRSRYQSNNLDTMEVSLSRLFKSCSAGDNTSNRNRSSLFNTDHSFLRPTNVRSNIPRSVRNTRAISCHSTTISRSDSPERNFKLSTTTSAKWRPNNTTIGRHSCNSSPSQSRSSSPGRGSFDTFLRTHSWLNLNNSRLPRTRHNTTASAPTSRHSSPGNSRPSSPPLSLLSQRQLADVTANRTSISRLPTRTSFRKKPVLPKK